MRRNRTRQNPHALLLLNPEGTVPATPQTQTPAFRRWFGDSKVVDENGEPLVYYRRARRHNPSRNIDLRGDERLPYADAVWSMYRKSYEKIGLIVGSGDELLTEYDVWEVTLDDAGNPIAFCLFKATPYGLKVGLSGSDGSPEGRAVARASFATKYQRPGVYGEVSHRPAELAREAGVPVVCANVAAMVLRKDIEPVDDVHYVRSLVNVGPVKKMLVGRPINVPTTDINAPVCPAVRMNPPTPTPDDLADFDAHYASLLAD